VTKGAMDGPAFAACVQKVLIPEIKPRNAVVFENLKMHRNKETTATLKVNGCWFLYLHRTPPRPEPNRVSLLELEDPPQTHRRTVIHISVQRDRRHL